MSTNYSLLFYLKKPKNYVSGPKPIYMRITVEGIPKEVSTGKDCDPCKWNSRGNRANTGPSGKHSGHMSGSSAECPDREILTPSIFTASDRNRGSEKEKQENPFIYNKLHLHLTCNQALPTLF
ncbi:Arm DNA-binding domain-containing protein [Sphingobacterium sp. UBA6645]|uniref:Arm DNA-binding domain-containing protein n=1 Tax=Sphingobacterium sp. UBA6645 TaxID=1947511 RepID=UPI0025F7BACD|nr:Arm DNA-binding domain-containing protein [Sphingobacterium sp. UBA6645]